MDKVALLTATYDCPYLVECLDSIGRQTLNGIHHLIVDDGSREPPDELIDKYVKSHPHIEVTHLKMTRKDRGLRTVATAWNMALSQLNPDDKYVAFLDSDEKWEPGGLARLVRALEDAPQAVAVYCELRLFGLETGISISTPTTGKSTREDFLDRGHINMGCCMFRRKTFDDLRGLDERMPRAQGWDFVLRATGLGDFVHVDKPLLLCRKHESDQLKNWAGLFYKTIACLKAGIPPTAWGWCDVKDTLGQTIIWLAVRDFMGDPRWADSYSGGEFDRYVVSTRKLLNDEEREDYRWGRAENATQTG